MIQNGGSTSCHNSISRKRMGESLDVLQLWRVCYAGNADEVERLIEEDVDFMERDRNGETVLHMAARADNADVVNILLSHLDPDVCNHNDQTPLHLAASKGHTEVIDMLILADCDLNQKTKYTEMTALHLACQNNQREAVSALLEAGAVCNAADTIGKPPEFHTHDPEIHQLFANHAKHCAHPIDKDSKLLYSTSHPDESHPEESLNTKPDREDEQKTKQSQKMQTNEPKSQWKQAAHKQKKVKINHGLGFSEEHKQRMQQNVFDRLMGNKKK